GRGPTRERAGGFGFRRTSGRCGAAAPAPPSDESPSPRDVTPDELVLPAPLLDGVRDARPVRGPGGQRRVLHVRHHALVLRPVEKDDAAVAVGERQRPGAGRTPAEGEAGNRPGV